jgi:pyruvate kinase
VCTIGPATADRIRELVETGMDVARINFSHGSPESHKQAVDAVRAAAHHARRSVAVMVDLPGPKIRLGELDGDVIELVAGRSFRLRRAGGAEGAGTDQAADVSHDGLAGLLQPGDRILLADGAAELRVTEINGDGAGVETEVVRGGTIRSRSGVNIPSERLQGPGLTPEDHEAVPRALAMRVDVIAQSFVRSAADVAELRALLPASNAPLVVAKIETRAAVENIDEIAAAADGLMVARGDLGVDLPFEDVPLIQKDLLRRAQACGRFTIVATQMLESMTAAPRPTRAEASDVANAVLDGADAVMLSAETAIGTYPIEAARAMVSICTATERDGSAHLRGLARNGGQPADNPHAIARAALMLADSYPAPTAIWCFTRTGRTAEMLSALRPLLPVVAFTLSPVVARRLAPLHAVVPVVLSTARTGEPLIRRMESAARAQHVIEAGSSATVVLVTTSAQPEGVNRLELHQV